MAVACGSDTATTTTGPSATTGGVGQTTAPPTTTGTTKPATTASSAAGGGGDLATAEFAASLEALAVGTYDAALAAATAGKLGDVPPVVAEFATTARAQHQAHLEALNTVITAAGKPKVDKPNAKYKAIVDGEFAKVTDIAGVAKLARQLEQIAAATYLKAIPTLQNKDVIEAVGNFHIIDMQHVAILNYALGEYPVPDVFGKTDMAATP